MFTKYLNKKLIKENLTDYEFFQPISNREFWEKMKKAGEAEMLEYKELFDSFTFEPLWASLFREFTTKKNRSNFEEKHNNRRKALMVYTFLEAFYNDDSYLYKALDMLWAILEETDWALPAHACNRDSYDSLPYHKEPNLDLFAAETSATIAFTYSVLKEKFAKISKNINRRIEDTVYERIIKNYLKEDEYWYMGYYGGLINNWNPWINSNVLLTAVVFEKDKKRMTDVVYKAMDTLNKYFSQYPYDGACDEGPSYWFQAGLRALECVEIISKLTAGKINIFGEQKLLNMAEYIEKAFIYDNKVVNFADAPSLLNPDSASLYKFGKILNDEKLIAFSKHCYNLSKAEKKEPVKSFNKVPLVAKRTYLKYELENELEGLNCSHSFIKEAYMPSTNFLCVRESEHSKDGLYMAAKGGHNAESHNHNDVGNFIIYKDGEPFIIDSGNMTYSALTFDAKYRYTLWTNVSEYHNLPTINGKNQLDGFDYKATDVSYESDDEKTVFSLDLKEAYENKEEIGKWVRTVTFDKKNSKITVKEDCSLNKAETVTLNFLSCNPFELTEAGAVMKSESGKSLKMSFCVNDFEANAETIEITDNSLKASWGDKLYRLRLNLKAVKADNIIEYTFI